MTGSFLKDLMHRVGSLAVNEADAPSDGDLLGRFVRDRDEAAFAGLLTRHAPLVWGVCRGLLSVDTDAEDAFQATFLALVRGARAVRTPHSLAPWLHATATRTAKKARSASARRAKWDRSAARPEANGAAVPDSAWEASFLAVHEEIARLPETLRGAFVLCVLEGDRHADAAAKLGVPVGTLSARVSRARQKLMDQLTARGLAPAAAAAALALGGSAGPAAVPTSLMHSTCSTLLAGATAVPASVLTLARAATEGSVMKAKLLAAGVMIAAGLAMSGGAARFGVAEAQQPSATINNNPGFNYNVSPPAHTALPSPQWEYRFEPRKSESLEVFEATLRALGREGWEYVGKESLNSDNPARKQELGTGPTLVFKRSAAATPTRLTPVSGYPATNLDPSTASIYSPPTIPQTGSAKAPDATAVLRLESGKAGEVAATISELFKGSDGRVSVSADGPGKQVVIKCSPADAATIIQLLGKSNLVTKLEMDFAPSTKPSVPTAGPPIATSDGVTPAYPPAAGNTRSTAYPVPKNVTWKDAQSKAADLARVIGLSVKVDVSDDGYHLQLKGPADDVEKLMGILPIALGKGEKTK